MYIYKKKDVKNSIFTKLRDKVVISKVISIIFYYFFFFLFLQFSLRIAVIVFQPEPSRATQSYKECPQNLARNRKSFSPFRSLLG